MAEVELTRSQAAAFRAVVDFLQGPAECFLLKGSAGTGKTTLVATLLRHLEQADRFFSLMAPTGRAARILGAKTRAQAVTIHRGIYFLDDIQVFEDAQARNDPGIRFVHPLKTDDPADTVFIVDESSMVGDRRFEADVLQFGSGRLLADLVEFARLARPGRDPAKGARIIFVGDPAQLPPVGDNRSPALSAEYLQDTFGVRCEEYELTDIVRQAAGSAVLDRAAALRGAIARRDFNSFGLAEADGEIRHVSAPAALDHIAAAFRTGSGSVLVTYTNAMALELNRAVRARLWGQEPAAPRVGDLLLINRNSASCGLMNGDLVKLVEASAEPEVRRVAMKGVDAPVVLTFRQARMAYRDADGRRIDIHALVLENLLESASRELSPLELRALLVDFRQRHPDLRPKSAEFRSALRQDPYFNAVQVKYGYALTCHKAQGGEWDTVVVNFSDASKDMRNAQFFRWAYTAITRARSKLLLVAPPRFESWSGIDFGPASVPPPRVEEHKETDAPAEADPDWNRFSFNPGQEALFRHHLRIRAALSDMDVEIVRLQHGQHVEKYWLDRGGAMAAVQYFYKGDQRVSSIVPAQGVRSDAALLQACLARMSQALLASAQVPGAAAAAVPDPFLDDFRRQLEQAITGEGLQVVAVEPGAYRLRVTVEGGGRRGRIDFHHDAKKRWTRATEVGGPGASQGICEQLGRLMRLDP